MAEYNGEMLRLAREFRGYVQRDIADFLKIEASTISRIENGLLHPSDDLISKVSDYLRLPIDFFCQTENVYGLPISVHPMWRKKTATSKKDIDKATAEINIRLLHIRRLLKSIEYKSVLPLPEFDIENYDGDIEKIAGMVRQTWHMPAGPVNDLTAWVERAGCFVIHMTLPDAAMAGVTMRLPDLPPCIFLNSTLPADRMRFTLAHELGHLVLHRYPTKDMENEANVFAAAFLMPSKDIAQAFVGRKIDLRVLAGLKPEWRVAMQSILYRAQELGYVSDRQAKYLWMQFNAHKIRLREPPELDFAREEPTLLSKLLTLHFENLGYTLDDFNIITKLHSEETASLYNLRGSVKRSMLSIVK
jgi:Zn-dependent peptidase ImmA (M78 family)/transcriptional regulator with XRE-family HTH domain